MVYMRFPPKVVNVCFRKKVEFDYKNNYMYNKLANSWLNIISKINCKILIVILYILFKLGFRKI